MHRAPEQQPLLPAQHTGQCLGPVQLRQLRQGNVRPDLMGLGKFSHRFPREKHASRQGGGGIVEGNALRLLQSLWALNGHRQQILRPGAVLQMAGNLTGPAAFRGGDQQGQQIFPLGIAGEDLICNLFPLKPSGGPGIAAAVIAKILVQCFHIVHAALAPQGVEHHAVSGDAAQRQRPCGISAGCPRTAEAVHLRSDGIPVCFGNLVPISAVGRGSRHQNQFPLRQFSLHLDGQLSRLSLPKGGGQLPLDGDHRQLRRHRTPHGRCRHSNNPLKKNQIIGATPHNRSFCALGSVFRQLARSFLEIRQDY